MMESRFFELPWVETIAESIEYLLAHQAVLAPIFLLILEESGIPLPVPGDVIIAYTGYNISRGQLPYWMAFVIILFSVLLGASILFLISARWGNLLILKYGKYLHITPKRLNFVERMFKKYGPLVIIFGRHIPGLRIPITVFAGISGVNYKTFILSTLVSVIFWILIYLDLGLKLGSKVTSLLRISVSHWLIIPVILVVIIAGFIYYRRLKII